MTRRACGTHWSPTCWTSAATLEMVVEPEREHAGARYWALSSRYEWRNALDQPRRFAAHAHSPRPSCSTPAPCQASFKDLGTAVGENLADQWSATSWVLGERGYVLHAGRSGHAPRPIVSCAQPAWPVLLTVLMLLAWQALQAEAERVRQLDWTFAGVAPAHG